MPRSAITLLFAALAVVLLNCCVFPHMNEDLFLGLCLGRDVAHGNFLEPNNWSYATQPQIFVDRAWLSHLVYYVSYAAAGGIGPVLVKGILVILYVLILYYRCRALGGSNHFSALAVTLGIFALAPFLSIRGENFGILCFLACGGILASHPSWGHWRQAGAVVVVAIWSNLHGTWPLGVLLMGIRFALDLSYTYGLLGYPHSVSGTPPPEEAGNRPYRFFGRTDSSGLTAPDAGGWLVALIALFPIIIAANPYTSGNLSVFSYVWGTSRYEDVAEWVDNLPIIHPTATMETKFYDAYSVFPFLLLLAALAVLLVLSKIMSRSAPGFSLLRDRPSYADRYMEAAMLALLIPMAFKWRRMIAFAAPGMVPFMAVLLQGYFGLAQERITRVRDFVSGRFYGPFMVGFAVVVLAVTGLFFYKTGVRPYQADNPMNTLTTEPRLVNRLLSYNLVWEDVLEFLKKNNMKGRIFAGIQLADYLLLNLKDIQIFMDLRAQAGYSPDNFRDYFAVTRTRPGGASLALAVLDRFKVDYVIMDSVLIDHRMVATALMETRKWGCIYQDRWVFVLARTDSGRLAPALGAANLDGLWYKDPGTRAVSQAILSLFMKDEVPPDLVGRLCEAAKKSPDPEIYSLVAMSMNKGARCLTDASKAFLTGELERLSKMDYMVSGSIRFILESQIRILYILSRNEHQCGDRQSAAMYRLRQIQVSNRTFELCRKYSVFGTCR